MPARFIGTSPTILRTQRRGRTTVHNNPSDPNFSSVALLMHFDGGSGSTSFIDSSSHATAITPVNSAAMSTTQIKFGPSSFQGSGTDPTAAYLSCSNANMQFGTNPWTIECFYFYNSTQDNFGTIVDGGANATGFACYFSPTTSLALATAGTGPLFAAAHGMSAGNWYHVAYVRDSNTFYIYVNGVSIGIHAAAATCSPGAGTLLIGTNSASLGSDACHGFIDELRITTGVCRYPGGTTFTPPTTAFPNH